MSAGVGRPPATSGIRRWGRRASSHATRRRLVALGCALVLAAAGCTYSREEPGLFRPPTEAATSSPVSSPPPKPTNPRLPVAGESVWTTAEGLDVQVRFAVHAVRRLAGATVLDWSVTPLQARGLSFGDNLPASVDLGLTRASPANVNVFLLDPVAGRVYRPLSHESAGEFNRCLCSPVWVAQLALRIGETRLLQIAYPELPASVRFVDVDLATLPPFTHVVVTPVGQVPTARGRTDLARPAVPTGGSRPLRFRRADDRADRTQGISVDRVVAGPARTSVEWTLSSITDQPRSTVLPYGPPISAELPRAVLVANPNSASGPRLRPAGVDAPVVGPLWMTDSLRGEGLLECLCSDFGLWASSLRRAGGHATVTTNYPALPPGVARVDLVLPGVGAIAGLPVSRAADGPARVGAPVPATVARWTYSTQFPPRGWDTADWPTPLPETSQLAAFVSTVDREVELPD